MKILQRVGILNRGGQETLWMNVLRCSDRRNMSIDFLVKNSEMGAYEQEAKSLGSSVFHQENLKSRSKIFKYVERANVIYKFFKEHPGYDVMHINTYLAIDALFDIIGGKLAKVPCIVVHSHNSTGPHHYIHFVCRTIVNMMNIERVACSKEAALWMFGTNKNVTMINNGIIVDNFKFDNDIRLKCRNELNISESEVLIGHVGRFDEQKNHSFLIDIFSKINYISNNYKLLLIGKGPLEESIRTKVHDLGLEERVIFYGSSNRVNELMMAMDIFLFPSLYEGLPLVLVEAQSSGLRCICSDTISNDTFITDLVTPIQLNDNPEEWAHSVIESFDYQRIDYSSKIRDKGFDILNTIEQLKQLYSRGKSM